MNLSYHTSNCIGSINNLSLAEIQFSSCLVWVNICVLNFAAQPSSSPFSRQELVQMVAMLRDACLGVVYLAIPDSKPVFDERRQFLENLGIKTNSAKRITKESYLRQRSEWVYLFTVSLAGFYVGWL